MLVFLLFSGLSKGTAGHILSSQLSLLIGISLHDQGYKMVITTSATLSSPHQPHSHHHISHTLITTSATLSSPHQNTLSSPHKPHSHHITLHYITLSAFQTPPTSKVTSGASTITCYHHISHTPHHHISHTLITTPATLSSPHQPHSHHHISHTLITTSATLSSSHKPHSHHHISHTLITTSNTLSSPHQPHSHHHISHTLITTSNTLSSPHKPHSHHITLHYITLSAFQTPPTSKVTSGASTITCYHHISHTLITT